MVGRHISTSQQFTVSHSLVVLVELESLLTVVATTVVSSVVVGTLVVVTLVVVSTVDSVTDAVVVVPSEAFIVLLVADIVTLFGTSRHNVVFSAWISDIVGTTLSPWVETVKLFSRHMVIEAEWTVTLVVFVCADTLIAVQNSAVHDITVTFIRSYTKWSVVQGATVELFRRNTEVELSVELALLDFMKLSNT